eukprot:m.286960 g.286960  ORF g.286960 m.286960 type:complete len:86 (+) comp15786_c0_seq1:998-1255(+)
MRRHSCTFPMKDSFDATCSQSICSEMARHNNNSWHDATRDDETVQHSAHYLQSCADKGNVCVCDARQTPLKEAQVCTDYPHDTKR